MASQPGLLPAARLFGRSPAAKVLTVVLTASIFRRGAYSDQGLPGVEQAAITGLIFGTVFAFTGCVFPLMFAHAAFDLTAVVMIYYNVESSVAHWIFK